MSITGCLSVNNTSYKKGQDAIYSILTSDSTVIVLDKVGNPKNLGIITTTFQLYDGGFLVDLTQLPSTNFSVIGSGTYFTITKNGINIILDSIPSNVNSYYLDFNYIYNDIVYTNRWNVDFVKDSADGAKLIYSDANIYTYAVDATPTESVPQWKGLIKNEPTQDIEIFPDGTILYSTESGKIYKANNLDDAWNDNFTLVLTSNSNNSLYSNCRIRIKDSTTAYFVSVNTSGTYSVLWQTTDKGTTWVEMISNLPITSFYKVYSLDELTIVVNNSTEVHRTTDGGVTWTTALTLSSGNILAFDFYSNVGMIVCNANIAYYSHDNGDTWSLSSVTYTGNIGLMCLTIISTTSFILGSGNGKIYISTDSGVTFPTERILPNNQYGSVTLQGLSALSPSIFYVYSGYQAYFKKTIDEGVTWTDESPLVVGGINGTLGGLSCVRMINEDTGLAGGASEYYSSFEIYVKKIVVTSPNYVPVERNPITIPTSGMFKYKGDVIKLKFSYSCDATSYQDGCYVGLKIGDNFVAKKILSLNSQEAGTIEVMLTAINGSYTESFLFNQEIELNVESEGVYNLSYQIAGGKIIANNNPSFVVTNTNLGDINIVYLYIDLNSYDTLQVSGISIEQIPNKNIQ